jgi:hypothetical protein
VRGVERTNSHIVSVTHPIMEENVLTIECRLRHTEWSTDTNVFLTAAI